MKQKNLTIYTSEIFQEDLDAAKEYIEENADEENYVATDGEIQEEAYSMKEIEYEDLDWEIKNFSKKHPGTYLIEGERITAAHYAAYIGRGGTYEPVECDDFEEAVHKCTRCADYDLEITETPEGDFVIDTYDHDGSCHFVIYRTENKRKLPVKFGQAVYGW